MKKCYALILAVLCFSCVSDEPDCVIDTSASGQIFRAVRSLDELDMGATEYFLGNEMAPTLCDSLVFSAISFGSFDVTLDSAYIDSCLECLEVLRWSGPGCVLDPDPSEQPVSFHDQLWRFSEVTVGDTLLYAPCGGSMSGRFHMDGTASFVMGNGYLVHYELAGQQLNFVFPWEMTLVQFGGYTGIVEDFISRHMLTLESWQVDLDQDSRQLVLSREGPTTRIVMIP